MAQRTPLAFDNRIKATNEARRLGAAVVVDDAKGNWWAVPLERYARGGVRLSGPWADGSEVDTDPTDAAGIARPLTGAR